MKLVLKQFVTDACTYAFHSFICFEYESKEQFLYDVFEEVKTRNWYEDGQFKLFDCYFTKEDIDDLERNVFTLEEWFEKEKFRLDVRVKATINLI